MNSVRYEKMEEGYCSMLNNKERFYLLEILSFKVYSSILKS